MNQLSKSDALACSQICLDCARACSETLTGCLSKGGKHADVGHITVLLDCMLICETAASFLNRGSSLCNPICMLCAEACRRCAEGCEGWDDAEMELCAEECRSCAESCRAMV